MRIALTHYNQMEKPDRDATQAKAAEREFKAFLEEFPDSPLHDEAAQKLRDTQEVLAEGNLRVANHYMILKRYEASKNRTIQVIEDYPDFSRQDEALWVLGQALEKQKLVPNAGYYYGKIVSDHPLSPLVENARKKLEDLNLPIPEVNPAGHGTGSGRPGEQAQQFLHGSRYESVQQEAQRFFGASFQQAQP